MANLVTLGSTGIVTDKNGFGALPIQRVSMEEAARLLRKAYRGGITFFDTARAYSDSEEKIGNALSDVREHLYLATKTMAATADELKKDLETSLRLLKTDHVDLYQFHNPSFCPKPGNGSGLYEAALQAKEEGMILHIGITNHRQKVAREAIESGLYETLQFPFSYLCSEQDLELVQMCRDHHMGFIAMKSLAGGLITDSAAAYAFASRYDHVLPIWGMQRERELDEFLSYIKNPPTLTEERLALIERDRAQLSGSFCRGCGYCMPCPVGIEINTSARISLLVRRSPSKKYFEAEWQEKMSRIHDCLHCNRCMSHCPYGLNTPELLARNLKDYEEILAGKEMLPDNF
ncbi:MAG: aldo/keto reductase [Clostridiales bacterium]|nr:aldo/keto reductase [Clostridiales bacterium]